MVLECKETAAGFQSESCRAEELSRQLRDASALSLAAKLARAPLTASVSEIAQLERLGLWVYFQPLADIVIKETRIGGRAGFIEGISYLPSAIRNVFNQIMIDVNVARQQREQEEASMNGNGDGL